jgi:hypothetical protein
MRLLKLYVCEQGTSSTCVVRVSEAADISRETVIGDSNVYAREVALFLSKGDAADALSLVTALLMTLNTLPQNSTRSTR